MTRPDDVTRRLRAGALYTQASNFLSHVSTGVDPRTSQFTLACELPALHANHLAGPVIQPALHFSPLGSHTDSGYGLGWTLGLSMLDFNTGQLRINSGDTFKFDSDRSDLSKGGQLVFEDQKLCSFEVFTVDDRARCFRIDYKDGVCEYLEVQDNSGMAMLKQIVSAQGRRAYLEWLAGSGPYLLWTIRDEQRLLLDVQHDRDETRFVMFPGSDSTTVVTLLRSDRLNELILPDGGNRWAFTYWQDPQSRLLFPSKVLGPLGSTDEVDYATGNNGLRLPQGAPLTALPRVSTHRHDPGAAQPVAYTTYALIGSNNCFGYGGVSAGEWADGKDNLYLLPRYDYGCLQTLHDEQGRKVQSVEYTWNHYHLQTQKLTVRGECRVCQQSVYADDPAVGWDDQPAWCQLPIARITRYETGNRFREERDTCEYDAYGNVLNQRFADGRSESREYYPLGGAQGCPDDGGRFVRWLKRFTTTAPAPDARSAGHVAHTDYAYVRLHKRQAEDRQHLVLDSEVAREAIDSGEAETARILQRVEQAADSPFHGLPISSVTLYNGYAATTNFLRTFEGPLLCETQQRISHDHLVISSSTLRHVLTGLTIEERNEHGTVTRFDHDALGRTIRRIESANTPYATSTRCTYQLVGLQRDRTVYVEQTDSNGQRLRVELDGQGRPVRELLEFLDSPGAPLREVRRVTYDVQGNVTSETSQDWAAAQNTPFCSSTVLTAYDDWGSACRVQHADGTVDHTKHDPIQRTQVSWQQSATGEQGPRTTLYLNASGSVERVELHEPGGGPLLRRERWTLDALQRPVAHTIETPDGEQRTTSTVYDRDGRVAQRTLQDHSRVKWRFAPHSDGDAIATLSLCTATRETLLLKQTFDGLDRPLTRDCGGQQETLAYVPGQIPPEALTRSNGSVTHFGYEPELDYQLKRIARPSENSESTFTYSPPHGRLTRATGGLGQIAWDFTASGVTSAEHWHHAGQPHTCGWQYSLNGRVLSFADVHGQMTYCTYDAVGRISGQHCGPLALQLGYDAFGRLAQTLTTDGQHGQSQQQTLTYDLLGREYTRTWVCHGISGMQRFRQRLSWTQQDQLATRTWESLEAEQATLLSEEHYRYDVRNRLVEATTQGPHLVTDPRTGQRIRRQTFCFNALDGYEQIDTEYENGQCNHMRFAYDSDVAADRPVQITHSWPQALIIDLEYDAAGQLTRERHDGQLWRALSWDSQGHLTRREDGTSTCDYAYDPLGRLIETRVNGTTSHRFYDGQRMVNEQSDQGWLTLMRAGSTVFAQTLLSQAVRTLVISASDGQGSVQIETGDSNCFVGYSAHGLDNGTAQSRVGYAGEVRETDSLLYMPGSNRPYDPCLFMFLSPDSASPDGAGGLNRYAYCSGDPVNRVDPDGHAWWNWVVAGIGLVMGAIAVVVTAGTAAPAVGAAYTALLGAGASTAGAAAGAVAAVATTSIAGAVSVAAVAVEAIALGSGAASMALEASGNEKAAGILGWISFGTGLASLGMSIGSSAPKVAAKANRLVGGLRNGQLLKRSASKFSSLPTVTTQPLSSAPKGAWKSFSTGQDKIIFGSNRPVAGKNFNTPLNYFRRRTSVNAVPREILIFSGSHGAPDGANWASNGIRRSTLINSDFFLSDTATHGGAVGGRVRVVDLKGMTEVEFGRYLNNNDSHVILGFCFGINDQALRFYKNLAPVTSYVP